MADVPASTSLLIAQFASGRLGQQVGDGECFALADSALRSRTLKSASDFGAVSANADYIWGREVSLSQVQVGDVIQFRNYTFDEAIHTETTRPDGSGGYNDESSSESRPHHTAIVASIGSNGELMVYEQNIGGQRVVLHNRLLFSSVTIGPTSTTVDGVTTTVTRTVTVSGTAKFYRAQTP